MTIEADTRVRIVSGPHRYCTGIVQSIVLGKRGSSDTATIALDSSGRLVVIEVEHLRPELASAFEGAT